MKRIILLVTCVLLLFSCGSEMNSTQQETILDSLSKPKNEQKKKANYGIKKGKLVYRTTVFGIDATSTFYFDLFGELESSINESEVFGVKSKITTIKKNGFLYTLNSTTKSGTRVKLNSDDVNDIKNLDFTNLEELKKTNMKILPSGTEKFLNKTCNVFLIENNDLKGKYLEWNGLLLKLIASKAGFEINVVVSELDENAKFPENVFEIPAEYSMSEK